MESAFQKLAQAGGWPSTGSAFTSFRPHWLTTKAVLPPATPTLLCLKSRKRLENSHANPAQLAHYGVPYLSSDLSLIAHSKDSTAASAFGSDQHALQGTVDMTKRRDFIKTSVAGAAGLAIGGIGSNARSYAAIVGANDRINLAVIGIRNQGTVHINSYCNLKNSKNVIVKTLCDTDERLFPPAVAIVNKKTGDQPLTQWDLKRVLDDKEIQAVSIVTPNHWHALATIWACQAGKHVYVEKPLSHNVWEGRKMIEAARKYDVRVQVGLNNRSSANVIEAIKFLHEGGIGEV